MGERDGALPPLPGMSQATIEVRVMRAGKLTLFSVLRLEADDVQERVELLLRGLRSVAAPDETVTVLVKDTA